MRDTIKAGMAKALHLSSWADRQESRGRTFPGQRIEDVAPAAIPALVSQAADRLLDRLEYANDGIDAETLFRLALIADAKRDAELGKVPFNKADAEAKYGDADLAAEFGHYIAMQAIGSGVAWTDDHADPNIHVPYFEFGEDDIEDLYWSAEASAALDRVRAGDRTLRLESANGGYPYTPVGDDDRLVLTAIGYPKGLRTEEARKAFEKLAPDYSLDFTIDGLEPSLMPH